MSIFEADAGAPLIISAVPTPFDDRGQVDADAFAELLSRLPADHADVLVAGTTGEFPALERDERRELIRIAAQTVGADHVIAHVGAASRYAVDELTADAESCGVVRVALLTPYYLPADAQQVVDHFCTFAEHHRSLQIYPYLFPDRTGVEVDAQAFAELMAPANIVGVKLSGRANDHFDDYRERLRPEQALYSGDDSRIGTIRGQGGTGVVSGCFPVVSELLLAAIGDQDRIGQIVGLLGPSIARQKYALQLITGKSWQARMSMPTLSNTTRAAIERLVG